jgi:hypothetical protein
VRKHFPDVAGSEPHPDAVPDSDTDAHADANADADADADTHSDAHSDAKSGRVRSIHHHHTESGAVDGRRRRGL